MLLVETLRNKKGTFHVFINDNYEHEIRVVVRDRKKYSNGKMIKICKGREEYEKYKRIILQDTQRIMDEAIALLKLVYE